MKYRPQRGGYADSMRECVSLRPEELRKHVGARRADKVKIVPYPEPILFDSRNGWNTHVVTVNGAAVGFTDGLI
jgi:hypothetical protein